MKSNRVSTALRSAIAFSVFAAAGAAARAETPRSTGPEPTLNLAVPAVDMADTFSSSSTEQNEVAVADRPLAIDEIDTAQPGRRYGRPRYRGGNTNPDGSSKFSFYAGAGFTNPLQNTRNNNTLSYGYQVGVGRNFNRNFGVNLEFSWDNFGLQGSTLNNQENLYNNYVAVYCSQNQTDPNCASGAYQVSGLDGYSHVWSFSLQPVYNIAVREGLGAFIEGGVGFYHKITTFTEPTVGYYCDPYYGYCTEYAANQTYDSYTSNAPGIDGGFGLTFKFSRFSNERFYADARYVYMFNQYKPGVNASTCTTFACAAATGNISNDYPQNSQRTSYIPVKFGVRF